LHRQLSRIHAWYFDDFREACFLGIPALQGLPRMRALCPGVAEIAQIGHRLMKKLFFPSKSDGYHTKWIWLRL